jgi:sugar phosphate isomerase/epimerase
MTRRTFLSAAAAAPLAAAAQNKPVLCIFSKHMAQFGYDDLGKKSKELGFAGVDLTVREKGHVLPENAAKDMPRAVEAIRSAGLEVPMITTNLLSADVAPARPTLSTAAQLKIPYWKIGYFQYRNRPVDVAVKETRDAVAGLVALSKEYGVQAGFHNHSGEYVGSPVWDIRDIIANMDPKYVGYYFDPAHATIEGGLGGWKTSLRLVMPRMKMVALKDFYWEKNATGKWALKWCPMGEGMVDWDKVFAEFARAGYAGPLSLHVEYDPKDELAAIAKDVEFIKGKLAKAYAG